MTGDLIPTLTHATERDIDLLLVEELHVSLPFVAWMLAGAGLPSGIVSATVLHSKRRTRSRREIDIFVEARVEPSLRVALLVENKLDASEQPDQAESYREELAAQAEHFAKAATVLVCPNAYRAQHAAFAEKFDVVIAYEHLAEWFLRRAAEGHDPVRMRFRAGIIEQAITKARRGYTPVPNETVGNFNARYVQLLSRVAPNILPGPSMLKPANPDESVSMIFDHNRSLAFLPADIRPSRFSHELGRGSETRANYAAVTFAGWGAALPRLKEVFRRDAEAIGASFTAKPPTKVRPNPGLVMSCATEPIDNQGSFAEQQAAIERGIETAVRLRQWLQDNQAVLRRWHSSVKATMSAS